MDYIQSNKNQTVTYDATVKQIATNVWNVKSYNPLTAPTKGYPDLNYMAMEKLTVTGVTLPKKYYAQRMSKQNDSSVNIPFYITWGIGEDSTNDLRKIPSAIFDNNGPAQNALLKLTELILDQNVIFNSEYTKLTSTSFGKYLESKHPGMVVYPVLTEKMHTVDDSPVSITIILTVSYAYDAHEPSYVDEYTIDCTSTTGITIRN